MEKEINIDEIRTWNDYKEYAKNIDPVAKQDLEEAEQMADIINTIIDRRAELGISQRDLASMCGLPQSSVARIETYKTTPKISTLVKIMHRLGLSLKVSKI
ncbi:MAG: helix-turn-helix transcriptional regulator [Lachnospiraceae bacterium]|nr:helix-turn-helix transcriptional regulator [Lachnospiraceae bacterium]